MANQSSLCYLTLVFLTTSFHSLALSQSLLNNNTDLEALLQFKSCITQDPFNNLLGWESKMTSHFCSWTGVECLKNNQRVISLNLTNMNLKGTITTFLGNLSLLTTLHLQYNLLSGSIPATLGQLTVLTHVNLSRNLLSGEIPGTLGSCKNLTTLDLSLNFISGNIPTELGRLKTLNSLILAVNYFNGAIPSALSNLTELEVLDLADNKLVGKIPTEIGYLKRLQLFNAQVNNLTGSIPVSISNCSDLRLISLIENMLTGEIPAELGTGLRKLQELSILNNSLSGRIPVTLSNISELRLLDLSVNFLSGEVPIELGRLKNLQILYLHSNNLTSAVSSPMAFLAALTNCSRLKKLHIGSNIFAGNLPDSIGHLSSHLYYFNLLDNRISGKIPAGIGNLSSLVRLTLSYNRLNGMIPASIGDLQELQILDLRKNRLQGSIPSEMGRMANLGLLNLDDNLIDGYIPASLGNLSQLIYLNLSYNRLSGPVPEEITRCSKLMLLNLSFNNLNGSLPPNLGALSSLTFSFDLSNNDLQGGLPTSIGQLINVQAIDLSNNRFSGNIPSSIGSCISLVYLNMSENNLEGPIPGTLSRIEYLQVLDLSFNNLTGRIPNSIGKNQKLLSLNLSYNRLVGDVPVILLEHGGLFKGNPGLCSSVSVHALPPCEFAETKKKKKKKKKIWVYILFAVSSCGVLLLCASVTVFLIYQSKQKKSKSVREFSVFPMKLLKESTTLTQRELELATDGFSEVNLLGRGGFSSVYKATLESDYGPKVVAVKVLEMNNEIGYRSFKRECKILSGIRHRNLVGILGAVWNVDFKALVMEFVDNQSLESHLYVKGDCELTLKDRLEIVIDVGNALEYLHEGCPVPILHCDLKPGNVLLDRDMVARVADFGIARLVSTDREGGATTTATGFGTIGYIPPEYGLTTEVSEKGDIYSFGIIMLEILTRKKPTGNLFMEELNLRTWVASSLSSCVLDVVDVSLKKAAMMENNGGREKLEQCFMEMIEVGLMCTEENPKRRPQISWITHKLEDIQKKFIGIDNASSINK